MTSGAAARDDSPTPCARWDMPTGKRLAVFLPEIVAVLERAGELDLDAGRGPEHHRRRNLSGRDNFMPEPALLAMAPPCARSTRNTEPGLALSSELG